jgi:hypothetical protein
MGDNPALSLPGASRAGKFQRGRERFAGAILRRRREQESEDLRKMNQSLLSTAFSHLWK